MNRVQQYNDENIVIVTNNVELTTDVVQENREMCRELMANMAGPIVLIIDYREVKTSFSDIIDIIKGNQAGNRADLNQRAFTIMVGEDRLISMYRDSMRQTGSGAVQVPIFPDMEKAIEAAEYYLQEQERQNQE